MLPPTKQEIANPYIDKVTDNMSGHYGMRGHLFTLFLSRILFLKPKPVNERSFELVLVLVNPLVGPSETTRMPVTTGNI